MNFVPDQNSKDMKNQVLATESFSAGKKHYFLDFNVAKNNSQYITITRSDWQEDGTYKRSQVTIFQEDFEFWIEAMASLFRSAAYQQAATQGDLFTPADKQVNGIKSWEPELRPREKMLEHGRGAMEDKELLAMLIGSGTPRQTAVELAERILASVEHDLDRLGKATVEELCRFKGMGHARALSVLSAMELAERRNTLLSKVGKLRAVR